MITVGEKFPPNSTNIYLILLGGWSGWFRGLESESVAIEGGPTWDTYDYAQNEPSENDDKSVQKSLREEPINEPYNATHPQ